MADKRNVGRKTEEIEKAELALEAGLPAPEVLAKYEKIVPGGAARLLELAEKRIVKEQRLEHGLRIARVVLAAATGVLGGVLLLGGSELAGLIIILAAVGILALNRGDSLKIG